MRRVKAASVLALSLPANATSLLQGEGQIISSRPPGADHPAEGETIAMQGPELQAAPNASWRKSYVLLIPSKFNLFLAFRLEKMGSLRNPTPHPPVFHKHDFS